MLKSPMSRGRKKYKLPTIEREGIVCDSSSSEKYFEVDSFRKLVPLTSWKSENGLELSHGKEREEYPLSTRRRETEDPGYESISDCYRNRDFGRSRISSVGSVKPFLTLPKHPGRIGGNSTPGKSDLQVPESMQRCRSEEIVRGEPVYESVVDARLKGSRKRSSGAVASLEALKSYFSRLKRQSFSNFVPPSSNASSPSESSVDDSTQTDSDEGQKNDSPVSTVRLRNRPVRRPLPLPPMSNHSDATSPVASDCSSRRSSRHYSDNSDYETLRDLKLDLRWNRQEGPLRRPHSCIEADLSNSCYDLNCNAVGRDGLKYKGGFVLPALRIGEQCHHMSMQELNTGKWKDLSTSSLPTRSRSSDRPWDTPTLSSTSSRTNILEHGVRASPRLRRHRTPVSPGLRAKWITERAPVTPQSLIKSLSADRGLDCIDATEQRMVVNAHRSSKNRVSSLSPPIYELESDPSSHPYLSIRNSASVFKKRHSYPVPGLSSTSKGSLLVRQRRRGGSAEWPPASPLSTSPPAIGNRPFGMRRWISNLVRPTDKKLDSQRHPEDSETNASADAECNCPSPSKRRLCPTCGAVTTARGDLRWPVDHANDKWLPVDQGDRLILAFSLYVVLMAVRISAGMLATLQLRTEVDDKFDSSVTTSEKLPEAHEYEDLANIGRAKTLRFRLKHGAKKLLDQSRKIWKFKTSKSSAGKHFAYDVSQPPSLGESKDPYVDGYGVERMDGDGDPSYAYIARKQRSASGDVDPLYSSIHGAAAFKDLAFDPAWSTTVQLPSVNSRAWSSSTSIGSDSYLSDTRYEDPEIVLAETASMNAHMNRPFSYLLSSTDWGNLRISYDDDKYLVPFDLCSSDVSDISSDADDDVVEPWTPMTEDVRL